MPTAICPCRPRSRARSTAPRERGHTPAGEPWRSAERCYKQPSALVSHDQHSVDHRVARTRHPDAVALDAAVEIAAVLVLPVEPLQGSGEHGGRGEGTRSRRPAAEAMRPDGAQASGTAHACRVVI